MDLALNNLQRLICYKNQPTKQTNKQKLQNRNVRLKNIAVSIGYCRWCKKSSLIFFNQLFVKIT